MKKLKGIKNQPISQVKWLKRDLLIANNWNPNKQASPETELLKISILEDGWTQPIVALDDNKGKSYTIIDGFHRYHVSGFEDVMEMTKGEVPVVILKITDEMHKRMSTIRHNRARGTHAVLQMAEIIKEMLDEGLGMKELCTRLQMEPDEVERLAMRVGIPMSDDIREKDFDMGWEPE